MTQMMVQAEANDIQREANQIQREYNTAYADYLNTQLAETQKHNRSLEYLQSQSNQLNDRYHAATVAVSAQKNRIDERLGMLRLEFDKANEQQKRAIEAEANSLSAQRNALTERQIGLDDYHRTQQEEIDKRKNDLQAEYNQQQAVKWGHDYELGLRAQETAEARQRSEEALNEAKRRQALTESAATVYTAKVKAIDTKSSILYRENEMEMAKKANARAEADSIFRRITDTVNSVGNLLRGAGTAFRLVPMATAADDAREAFNNLFK